MTDSASLFSEKDHQDLDRLTVEIRHFRRLGRGHDHDIGSRMVEVRDRALWEIEGFKNVYEWIWKKFRVRRRRADTYMVVGGKLKRERVEQGELTLEEWEVVGRSAPELQDWVEEVAGMGVSIKALRAGRDAGALALVEQEDEQRSEEERIAEAKEVVLRVARAVDAGTYEGPKTPADRLVARAGQATRRQLSRMVELRRRLAAGEKVPAAEVRSVADSAEKMAEQARLLAEEAAAAEAAGLAVDCKIAGPAKTAEPAVHAVDCKAVDWEPMIEAGRELDEKYRLWVGHSLFGLGRGDDFAKHERFLRSCEPEFERRKPLPPGLFETWLSRLAQSDDEARGLFALRYCRRAQLLGYRENLERLSGLTLPPKVSALVQSELERVAALHEQAAQAVAST